MKLECRYREPQPTKKDKTLVEILDKLKKLESKIDRLPMRPLPPGFGPAQMSPASQPSFPDTDPGSYTTSSIQASQTQSPAGFAGKNQPYRHASAAHKMLIWPAIQQVLAHLQSSSIHDLRRLEMEGSAFILSLYESTPQLPHDEVLLERPFMGMQMQSTRTANGARVTFPELTKEVMAKLATSYFDTFNLIYPFMDRESFMSETLIKVHTEGFDADADSVLALLVLALGELAIAGSSGRPVDSYMGRPSGIRGGNIERPPGLALFNEARKRIGFVYINCDLAGVQITSLIALYYESCSRHVDFWRTTVMASQACQLLITCTPIDWDSQRGDLIKRAYWHCAIMETGLHLELDLPLTGVISLEDKVPLPSFNTPFCEADHNGNLASHFEAHFASQIALRRLCANLHNNINNPMGMDTPSSSNEDFNGPAVSTLKQLAAQLDQWKSMLPPPLRWPEDDPSAFPAQRYAAQQQPQRHQQHEQTHYGQLSLDPSLSYDHMGSKRQFFTSDINSEPVHFPYVYDIQVALLRTRYYYAKYTIYRPFIYKALHFPDHMTQDDAEGVVCCLKSCLKWPILLSPPSRQKRLIPYLFCWSQNCLGILLIFHMTHQSPVLQRIRQQVAARDPKFERDVEETIQLMLDWIRDLKTSDPIAEWCYSTLRNIYNLEP